IRGRNVTGVQTCALPICRWVENPLLKKDCAENRDILIIVIKGIQKFKKGCLTMRLSTSTNFFATAIDREFISFKESIRRCKAVEIGRASCREGESLADGA